MTFSKIGRFVLALVASAALGLGMTACGGGTVGYLWVAGTFYNQISGFKIDNYTGNLTQIEHSPFPSGGSNPQTLVVKTGGRFVYVVNQGFDQTATAAAVPSSISEFSVGGDGVLTHQQDYFSQGTHSLWATFDASGTYLYVLDKYSKNYGQPLPGGGIDLNGSITAFSSDASTGRLTLVPNQAVLDANGVATTYFEVGPNPTMSKVGSGSCLYTIQGNTIFPYVISSATGQLTVATTGPLTVQSGTSVLPSLTSINASVGTSVGFIYLTDGANNQIYSFQSAGTTCTLSPIAASQQTNVAVGVIPTNSLTSNSGKFLYVVNSSTTAGNQSPAQSSISAYTIDSTGRLTALVDGTNNPYAVGSGPVCIVQDPTNQYLYISNNTDSTITGKLLDQSRGYLSNLSHGSSFNVTQNPTCLAVSGNI